MNFATTPAECHARRIARVPGDVSVPEDFAMRFLEFSQIIVT